MSHQPALIWGARTIDYPRLEQYVASVIKHLKGRGLKVGDRVAIIEPNSIEYVIVLLALWKMGVVACPLNPRWPYESLGDCIQALNPKVILTSQKQFLSSKRYTVPVIELKSLISFDARQNQEVKVEGIHLDQEATVIWTSGSSSAPKAAVHTWANHVYSAEGSQETIPLKAGDRWVLSLPLYHVSGISIVCRCYLAQAAIVICSDEDDLAQVIAKGKPTHISMVATQLYRLLEDKEHQELLKTLKFILLGGSAIPSALLEKALFLDLPVYTSYGLTEMSSQVATGKVVAVDKSCAKILPHRQLKIDKDGQILVKGKVLFKGYIQQNKLVLTLDDEGWFKTGDLGKIDGQGCVTVLGRRDNMFICAGENIQPEEIEAVLMRLTSVRQAIVVAQDDPEYGKRPIAFVRMHGAFNEGLLRSHCGQYLPKIKVPVAFYSWPEALTQGFKISRKFFQERLGNR